MYHKWLLPGPTPSSVHSISPHKVLNFAYVVACMYYVVPQSTSLQSPTFESTMNAVLYVCTLPFKMFGPFWSVRCKTALAEVDVSLLWWCHALLPLAPGYWRLFLDLIIFSYWKNDQFQRKFYVNVESLKFQQFYLMKFDFFQSFNFDLKFLWNWPFFQYEKIMRSEKSPQ